ncbi:MAG: type II secretion system minor pseudopilin GspK [Pseudomonadota bacterium]
MRGPVWSNERGAALLTVMMIVAAMSVAALAVTQSVTQATMRSRALDAQAQLLLYAASAEEVAKARMAEVLTPLDNKLNSDLPGLGVPQIIPLDQGALTVTARDASNCFNVNQLTRSAEGGVLAADPDAQKAYQTLLTETIEDGFSSDMVALVSALTDWMDDNTVPSNGGAEDGYYLSEVPSYRTSGQKLSSVSELRAMRGYTIDVYMQIRPLLCALPDAVDSTGRKLNINTLDERHAPLLKIAFGEALSMDDARELISLRPLGGWTDVEAMLEDPLLNRIDPDRIRTDQLGVLTSLVEVSANVSYRGHDMTMLYLFQVEPGRPIKTILRERIG